MSPVFVFFFMEMSSEITPVYLHFSSLQSPHVMWSAVHSPSLQQRKQYIAPLHVHKFLFTALEWLDVI